MGMRLRRGCGLVLMGKEEKRMREGRTAEMMAESVTRDLGLVHKWRACNTGIVRNVCLVLSRFLALSS